MSAGIHINPLDHIALVHGIAKRFTWALAYVPREDLIQEGYVALCSAARGYDGRGEFSTYAWVAIQRAMYRVCDRMGGVICLPERSINQMPQHLRAQRERVRSGVMAFETDLYLVDGGPTALQEMEHEERIAELRAAVEELSPRLREIVERYWWGGETLQDIASDWGVSRERVRQLHVHALKLLKGRL